MLQNDWGFFKSILIRSYHFNFLSTKNIGSRDLDLCKVMNVFYLHFYVKLWKMTCTLTKNLEAILRQMKRLNAFSENQYFIELQTIFAMN